MFCKAVTGRVVFIAVLAFLIDGGATVFAQVKSSTFYSTYDARELVKNKKYKGIDFAYGELADESVFEVSPKSKSMSPPELPAARSERTKFISYGCRIQTTGDEAFDVANFLDWLAQETIKRIESEKGRC